MLPNKSAITNRNLETTRFLKYITEPGVLSVV